MIIKYTYNVLYVTTYNIFDIIIINKIRRQIACSTGSPDPSKQGKQGTST